MFEIVLLTIIATVLLGGYVFVRHRYGYWKRLGVPHIPPEFPFGNRTKATRQISLLLHEFYKKLKRSDYPLFGMYFMQSPIAVVSSLKLAKSVLIKDFQYFADRGVYSNETADPLSAHLFAVGGEKWRKLRYELTPTFTSGKMKFMYPTMFKVGKQLDKCLENMLDDGAVQVEMKDLLARFTTDVIGSCAFGIDCNSLENPHAEFREMGKRIFGTPRHSAVVSSLIGSYQGIARWFGLKVLRDDVSDFFLKVVRETVAYREENGVHRNDFMDLLIALKNKENDWFNLEEIAAQAFIFFFAGFETSSTTIMFAIYELALNLKMQWRVRNEIKMVLQKYGGILTYKAMMDMKYLKQVVDGKQKFINNVFTILIYNIKSESLRKYPPVGTLIRMATKPYSVPETNVVLPTGTTIIVPVYAINHDPEIYPSPETFDPDRFTQHAVADRDRMAFLAFGDGPRNCIGARFGQMQTYIGLTTLLRGYEFNVCSKTPAVPLVMTNNNFILTPESGMWLNVHKL